jgi:cell fate (sporulation/competence/biofilm development) regulator YlbF (YheA/YmcA/DUF963 family)
MDKFQEHYEAALHHMRTVLSAQDDREAVRRFMVAKKRIEDCIDDINSKTK